MSIHSFCALKKTQTRKSVKLSPEGTWPLARQIHYLVPGGIERGGVRAGREGACLPFKLPILIQLQTAIEASCKHRIGGGGEGRWRGKGGERGKGRDKGGGEEEGGRREGKGREGWGRGEGKGWDGERVGGTGEREGWVRDGNMIWCLNSCYAVQ